LALNKIFYEGIQTALREGTCDENGILCSIEVYFTILHSKYIIYNQLALGVGDYDYWSPGWIDQKLLTAAVTVSRTQSINDNSSWLMLQLGLAGNAASA